MTPPSPFAFRRTAAVAIPVGIAGLITGALMVLLARPSAALVLLTAVPAVTTLLCGLRCREIGRQR